MEEETTLQLEWRDSRVARKIRAYKKGSVGMNPVAICGIQQRGAVTVPLGDIEDVESKRVCKLCLRRGRW